MENKTLLTIFRSLIILVILSTSIFYFENIFITKHYSNFLSKFSDMSVINIIFVSIIQTILLSLGVPSTPLIIINFIFFSAFGFLISLISLLLSSVIIFKYSIYIEKLFNFKNNYQKYFLLLKNKNFFIKVFTTRFIIPMFFHNLIFGIIKSNLRIFILAVLISDFIAICLIYFIKELF